MTQQSITPSTRPAPHPIKDFFIAELIDYAPKDHPDMMQQPVERRRESKLAEVRLD